jgi:outer membrane lipoprotein-sorting protein
MHHKEMAVALFFALTLTASGGAFASKPAPMEKIQDLTADSLGLETEDFTVSDVEKDGQATRYVVTVKGKGGPTYKCYITDGPSGLLGVVTGKKVYSDALCKEKGKRAKNALLEAAGQE